MEKALARNPNLLRTLVGLSVSLILVLSYAVYSATLDSEFYLYHTDMEENPITFVEPNGDNSDNLTWTGFSSGSISWVNFTVEGAPEGAVLTILSGGSRWWSHERLGSDDGTPFNCLTPNTDFELVNHCTYDFQHTAIVGENGVATVRGIVVDALPLSGTSSLTANSLDEANSSVSEIMEDSLVEVTWMIELTHTTEMDPTLIELSGSQVNHSLTSVEPFSLNPVTETIWSLTALLGCFAIVLAVPMGFYFSSLVKSKNEESKRATSEEE